MLLLPVYREKTNLASATEENIVLSCGFTVCFLPMTQARETGLVAVMYLVPFSSSFLLPFFLLHRAL